MKYVQYIGVALLVSIFVRHNAYNAAADLFGANVRMMNSLFGAALEAALALLFLPFIRRMAGFPRDISLLAIAIAVIESTQTLVCRPLIPSLSAVPLGTNLCDHVTGLHTGAAITSSYFFAAIFIIGRWWHAQRST